MTHSVTGHLWVVDREGAVFIRTRLELDRPDLATSGVRLAVSISRIFSIVVYVSCYSLSHVHLIHATQSRLLPSQSISLSVAHFRLVLLRSAWTVGRANPGLSLFLLFFLWFSLNLDAISLLYLCLFLVRLSISCMSVCLVCLSTLSISLHCPFLSTVPVSVYVSPSLRSPSSDLCLIDVLLLAQLGPSCCCAQLL